MKIFYCLLSCALLMNNATLFSYVSPDKVDNLIAIHEEWCPTFGENWTEEAREILNISNEQECLHSLNTLAAICKIDQARKSGSWDDFFVHIGGSHQKIGHAIDLSIQVFSFWNDFDASEVFYNYIMTHNIVHTESQKWPVFADHITQVQYDRGDEAPFVHNVVSNSLNEIRHRLTALEVYCGLRS